MPILLALFLALAVVAPSQAAEDTQSAAPSAVKADVMYWEGEEVVVKEISGRELRLHPLGEIGELRHRKVQFALKKLGKGHVETEEQPEPARSIDERWRVTCDIFCRRLSAFIGGSLAFQID